jgi:nicotinamide N-methyltransferase
MIAALRGAKRTVVTDYPAEEVVENIRENVKSNLTVKRKGKIQGSVEVEGHEWGKVDDSFSMENKGVFERVLVADCLWMPWQHGNLRRSIAWFLSPSIAPSSRNSSDSNSVDDSTHPSESGVPSHHQPPSPTHPCYPSSGGLAYVIAGFHTGRAKLAPFFDEEAMKEDGLVVERIWERNAEGMEREWRFDRGEEDKDVTGRKRWLVVGIVRRLRWGDDV